MLIFYRFSRCTKDYLQYPSATCLLSVLLLIPEDILPKLRKTDLLSSWVIDRWNQLQQSVVDSGSVNSFKNGLDRTRKATMGFFTD